MERHVIEQIKYGLRYVPLSLAKSLVIPSSSKETETLRKRGFLCGVCHPDKNYEQIKRRISVGSVSISLSPTMRTAVYPTLIWDLKGERSHMCSRALK